jgi:hypothetical protein
MYIKVLGILIGILVLSLGFQLFYTKEGFADEISWDTPYSPELLDNAADQEITASAAAEAQAESEEAATKVGDTFKDLERARQAHVEAAKKAADARKIADELLSAEQKSQLASKSASDAVDAAKADVFKAEGLRRAAADNLSKVTTDALNKNKAQLEKVNTTSKTLTDASNASLKAAQARDGTTSALRDALAAQQIAAANAAAAVTKYNNEKNVATRYVRIDQANQYLHIRELQVLDANGNNVALKGKASMSSSPDPSNPAWLRDHGPDRVNDNNHGTLNHTEVSPKEWIELDLLTDVVVAKVLVFNRDDTYDFRLAGSKLTLLDKDRRQIGGVNVLNADRVQTFNL